MSTERINFVHPQPIRTYGFRHGELIAEPRSASGFRLGFDALDAYSKSLANGEPCEFLVVGEDRADDGRIFPVLGINPEYMSRRGYIEETTKSGRIVGWHLPKGARADDDA